MSTRTITALYDSYDAATRAVTKLEAAGIPHSDISLVGTNKEAETGDHSKTADHAETGAGTGATLGTVLGGGAGLLAGLGLMAIPGVGPVVAAGWLVATLTGAGVGAAAGGLAGSLTGAGIGEADAHTYAEGVRRGGTLLTVRADQAHETRVIDILEEHGAVDLDERERNWKSEGWTAPTASGSQTATARADATPSPFAPASGTSGQTATSGTSAHGATGRDETIPIVEERLNVGTREVEQGRVRVRSYAVETPVNEQVRLHDESVHVDRRPVDRALKEGDAALFKDRTIEATERREEAVVSKDARIVEEIGLRKEASDRKETITDNVRRTEVEVEDERGKVSRTGTTDPLTKR